MSIKIHGAATAHKVLSNDIKYFVMYVSAPNVISNPSEVTGLNIQITGNINDESQKNFEILLQCIGLRSMPVEMSNPEKVKDLSKVSKLTGEGFEWKFAVEMANVFSKNGNPVGLLEEEINGIVMPTGAVARTTGLYKNIEFNECDV